jgi:hypothetical protein
MKRCSICKRDFPDDANFCPVDAKSLDTVSAEPTPAKTVMGIGIGPLAAKSPAMAPKPERTPPPVLVAPQVIAAKTDKTPPPVVAHTDGTVHEPSGKRRKEKSNKFRETLWFKKGELDAAAAQNAAKNGKEDVLDQVDYMPTEDRYKDDGSLTSADESRLSLRRGNTLRPDNRVSAQLGNVSEKELIRELKSGRNAILIGCVVGLIALILFATFVL